MPSAHSVQARVSAQQFISAMNAALRPLSDEGGRIGTPGTQALFRRNVVGYAGGPYQRPTRAMPTPPRTGDFENAAGNPLYQRGGFRLSGTFDRIYAEIDDAFVESILSVFDDANAFMREISPVDTGEYQKHVIVDILAYYGEGTTTPRRNRFFRIQCRMMTEEENPYNPKRDPRVYAIYVEYGGGHTPPYFVFRRTMDYTIRLAIQRFQAATGGTAFRGITPRPA